jgi:hypothetical protein
VTVILGDLNTRAIRSFRAATIPSTLNNYERLARDLVIKHACSTVCNNTLRFLFAHLRLPKAPGFYNPKRAGMNAPRSSQCSIDIGSNDRPGNGSDSQFPVSMRENEPRRRQSSCPFSWLQALTCRHSYTQKRRCWAGSLAFFLHSPSRARGLRHPHPWQDCGTKDESLTFPLSTQTTSQEKPREQS